ncbi:MAG: glycosyltransferase family 2 protein [Synergistaceae bacterium]|jgi:glycosyltransferase involved in cell wall biosynthesis|nr:glycosyltransferase family 2 protein [Synergistaceae bacterium]
MHIEKLSLFIITQNEEKRLPLVLESVKGLADELVVVDSGSTDGTEEIVKRYGGSFLRHEWESVGHQVKWAEEHCAYRWVLRLDADEVVPQELAVEIKNVRENGTFDAYYLRIAEMVVGRAKPIRWVKHYKLIRLYNRDAYEMAGTIGHDDVIKIKPGASAGYMKNLVYHYSYTSIHQLVEKHNLETDRLVERAVTLGKNYSPWRIAGALSLNFSKRFFLDRFFLYGFWGYMYSVDYAYLRFLKFSKFYEAKQLEEHEYLPSHLCDASRRNGAIDE